MSNKKPSPPDIDDSCPISETVTPYNTTSESVLNVSRKDKFILVLDLPHTLKPLLANQSRFCNRGDFMRLQFSVWGAVIPEISINKIEAPFSGQTLKFSGNSRPSYPAVTCNFTIDNKYENYYLLWKWLDIQNGAEDGFSEERIKDYATTIELYALDEYNKPAASFLFTDAFITSIGGINKSYRDAGENESSFTFDFSQLFMKLI